MIRRPWRRSRRALSRALLLFWFLSLAAAVPPPGTARAALAPRPVALTLGKPFEGTVTADRELQVRVGAVDPKSVYGIAVTMLRPGALAPGEDGAGGDAAHAAMRAG